MYSRALFVFVIKASVCLVIEWFSQMALIAEQVKWWVTLSAIHRLFNKMVIEVWVRKTIKELSSIEEQKNNVDWWGGLRMETSQDATLQRRIPRVLGGYHYAYQSLLYSVDNLIIPLLTSLWFLTNIIIGDYRVLGLAPVGYIVYRLSFCLFPYCPPITFDAWRKVWDGISALDKALHTDTIHGNARRNRVLLDNQIGNMHRMEIEDNENKDRETNRAMFIFYLIVLPVVFFMEFGSPLVFIKNFSILTSLMSTTTHLSKSWGVYQREKVKIQGLKEDAGPPEEEHPVLNAQDRNQLVISKLQITRGPFSLTIAPDTEIELLSGTASLFSGKSGSGKSTFFDMVTGVSPTERLSNHEIWLNGQLIEGFKRFVGAVVYLTQDFQLFQQCSIFETVVGTEEVKKRGVVLDALRLAQCSDFVWCDIGEPIGNMKSIDQPNPGMSGGQKQRLCLARCLYQYLITRNSGKKPMMVVIDEVDRALQEEMAVELVTKLVDTLKKDGVIVLACVHSERVKECSVWNKVYKVGETPGQITSQ